jgi:hypothetical protein
MRPGLASGGNADHFARMRRMGSLFQAAILLSLLCQSGLGQTPVFIRANTGATFPALSHKLSLAISTNGHDWQSLHTTPTLTNFSRDASILRHGNEFVTVYSDDFALNPFGYSTNGTFGLARSTDLVNWQATHVKLRGPLLSNAVPNNTWAPEWFVEGTNYYVLVRLSTTLSNNYGPPGIGYLQCHDPGTWTNWSDFTLLPGLASNENDPFLLKVGSTYHLFTDDGGPHSGKILHRQSTTSPFEGYGAPAIIGTNFRQAAALTNSSAWWQATPFEGQFVVPLGGDRYRLYFQATWWDHCFAIESTNGMATWDITTMRQLTYDGKPAFGHGSVMTLEATDALLPLAALAQRADQAITEVQTIQTNPNAYNLYTATQFTGNRTAGRTDVLADPGSYGLFTEDSITDLNLGGAMIQKSGSNVVVHLQLQTTPDLSTSFTNHGEPVGIEVDLPGDKHFLRIRALRPQ